MTHTDLPLDAARIWAEYDRAVQFNRGIGLYDTVENNENFFIGRQWEGVKSNGLPTPVFNFLKRVVMFSVANIAAERIKLHASPLAAVSDIDIRTLDAFSSVLNEQFAAICEQNDFSGKVREFCRNAAVDGDGCLYAYWDEEAMSSGNTKGAVRVEVLPNTQVLFGNPNERDVQRQPYLLLTRRMLLDEAKRYAFAHGVRDAERICADGRTDFRERLDALGGEKVTVLTRLWKDEKTGHVFACECTKDQLLRKPWDLGISLYPLVWMPWDYVSDCYHGQAMITGLIPNQIFVNKLYAMSMISLMTLAYPKVIYDRTRIREWTNRVGAAVGVNGAVEDVAKIIDPAAISPQIAQFISLAVSDTQKFLGASDAALGDVRPDNTSAIIALQRAATTPLGITKQNLLSCIEQMGRIFIAFMAEYYGSRTVEIETEDKLRLAVPFDFSILGKVPCALDIDAGAGAYWSEIANMQTLDNLLMQGKIPTSEYLRRLPEGQISDREALITIMERAERGESAP